MRLLVLAAVIAGALSVSTSTRAASVPAVRFGRPAGVTVDGTGNLYVTDAARSQVVKLDASGTVLARFGGRGKGPGRLSNPGGLTIGRGGSILVADTGNGSVDKLSRAGKPLARWGNSGRRLLFMPGDLALDGRGNVYVADGQDAWIEKLSPSGRHLARLGSFSNPGQGQFVGPTAVALDSRGDIFVGDYGWVGELSPAGKLLRTWGLGKSGFGILGPVGGIAVSGNRVYATSESRNKVWMLRPNGRAVTFAAGVSTPVGIAVSRSGLVFVAVSGGSKAGIARFSAAGTFLGLWR